VIRSGIAQVPCSGDGSWTGSSSLVLHRRWLGEAVGRPTGQRRLSVGSPCFKPGVKLTSGPLFLEGTASTLPECVRRAQYRQAGREKEKVCRKQTVSRKSALPVPPGVGQSAPGRNILGHTASESNIRLNIVNTTLPNEINHTSYIFNYGSALPARTLRNLRLVMGTYYSLSYVLVYLLLS
jgi:hypothetical protein